jgi:hypothetical protein
MDKHAVILLAAALSVAGCDQVNQRLGLEDPVRKEARLEAEGKAVGSACRHSGRAIEDCYSIYRWLAKANIYTGWMEMDAYMRENSIETIAPQLPPAPPPEPPEKKKKKKPKPEGENADGAKEGEAPPEAAKDAGGKPAGEEVKDAAKDSGKTGKH